ncbi:FecR domain-containing protein [Caulobacter sp. UNC279MFTsu5.1]|uniref:FecR family protein n=1 Tax=Caulobacter sp. UNC279MFTsu5.1 TaxID=1502775 RepID=UPI000367C72C|nr:FecR domain-containing protein [Caulobacter sp. UNC279MFTsu5.1]SFK56603.1 FecR family protein [Caulobacter sp. UNC279MFTsu5.1]
MSAALQDRAAEVAAWFARRRAGTLTRDDQNAFQAWLDADPGNREAFEAASDLWDDFDGLRTDPRLMRLREEAKGALGRQRVRRRIGAIAACAALVLGGVAAWRGGRDLLAIIAPQPTTYATRVGQTMSVSLPDGSLAVLDTNSELRAWAPGKTRRLELARGRAFFKVAKDPARPFVVRAGEHSVTALGTQFDVDLRPAAFKVVLSEGRVRVKSERPVGGAASSVDMNAGYQLVARDGNWNLSRVDTRSAEGWMSGRLVFDDAPLAVIAAELSRYSTAPITVAPDVADRRMSAVLPTKDPEAFVASAEALGLARRAPGGGYALTGP